MDIREEGNVVIWVEILVSDAEAVIWGRKHFLFGLLPSDHWISSDNVGAFDDAVSDRMPGISLEYLCRLGHILRSEHDIHVVVPGNKVSPLLSEYSGTKAFVELFSRGLAAEYASKGVHVQVQSPLLVTTKLSKVKKSAWDKPSPDAYARAAVKRIGYETECSPFWSHQLQVNVLRCLPESITAYIVGGLHRSIRKRALAKKTK